MKSLAPDKSALDPAHSEDTLWRTWTEKKSLDAREKLFTMHYSFALQTAKRHHFEWTGSDLELADLRQAACVGLLEAIDHFKPQRGVPFRAYARGRVKGSVLDAAAKASEVREQLAARNRARQERLRSLQKKHADPKPTDALEDLMEMAVGLAIGFMLEGSNLYHQDETPDPAPNAYENLAWRETLERLQLAVAALPEKEKLVLKHHYSGGLSFEQIGALLGLTRGRISQIHKEAITRLRLNLTKQRSFTIKT